MNVLKLAAALMSIGLLVGTPAFAQSNAPKKQPTQEGGGPSEPMPCGLPYNANPTADPDCRQRTQSLVPTSGQTNSQAAVQSK